MKPLFSTLFAFVAVAMAGAQAASRTEEAVRITYERLAKEIALRAGDPKDVNAIARNPMHVVFLVDTSHADDREASTEFTRKFVSGFARMLGKAQKEAGIPRDAAHLVSFFPYQTALISSADRTMRGERLVAGGGVGQKLQELVPNVRIPVPGETGRGHDSTGARAAVAKLVGQGGPDRETVIVQITNSGMNQDPDRPANDRKIRALDARTSGLEKSGFEAYPFVGRTFQTDDPGRGVRPYDMYVWTYGPPSFTVPPDIPGSSGQSEIPPPPPPKSSLMPIVIGLAILGAIIWLVLRFLRKVPVALAGSARKVSMSAPLKIKSPGGPSDPESLLLPESSRGMVASGNVVGKVMLGLFGGPKLEGDGGYSLQVDGVKVDAPVAIPSDSVIIFVRDGASSGPVKFS